VLLVAADHGASFYRNDGYRVVTATNYGDIMAVPLFLKLPGQQQGMIDERPIEVVDIFPTLATLLGVEPKDSIDGRAFLTADGASNGFERQQRHFWNFLSRWENKEIVYPTRWNVVEETVARKYQFFPDIERASFYKVGKHFGLIGTNVASLSVRKNVGISGTIDQMQLLSRVKLSSNFLPGLMTGTLDLSEGATIPSTLAVALNGSIQAVTEAHRNRSGDTVFTALLPEHAFRKGENTVGLYSVDTSSNEYELTELFGPAQSFGCTIEETQAGGEVIVLERGGSLPVIPGRVQGFLDHVDFRNQTVAFSGWAAELGVCPSINVRCFVKCEGTAKGIG